MKFRLARHSNDLQPLIDFYCGILDFEILGEFHNHDGYNGVFIGNRDENWHLEFTVSSEKTISKPDDDDLIVFYTESDAEFEHIIEKFRLNGVEAVVAKNPYWEIHGKTYLDPEGFRVVISKTNQ